GGAGRRREPAEGSALGVGRDRGHGGARARHGRRGPGHVMAAADLVARAVSGGQALGPGLRGREPLGQVLQGQRIAPDDAAVLAVEELEEDPADAELLEYGPERPGAEVEVVLVALARVDV